MADQPKPRRRTILNSTESIGEIQTPILIDVGKATVPGARPPY